MQGWIDGEQIGVTDQHAAVTLDRAADERSTGSLTNPGLPAIRNRVRPSDRPRQENQLTDEHIEKILETYQKRPKQIERYSRRVEMKEIAENDFNLNISRYVSTATEEEEIDLAKTHRELVAIDDRLRAATDKHNRFLKELGLSPLP